jgi:uncharacterized phiE125 gp8 family phage protein
MRRFILERSIAPEIEPVTLAEARRHLRVDADNTTEDDDITPLIAVAREMVESYTGRVLIDQTWRLTIDDLRGNLFGDSVGGYTNLQGPFQWWRGRVGEIMLRKSPALALSSFVSVGADGAETTIDADTYQLREAGSRWPRIVALSGATWGLGAFRITFRAGFADRTGSPQQGADFVPARYRQAMKLIIGHLYENRESVVLGSIPTELPMGVKWLLRSDRAELGFA